MRYVRFQGLQENKLSTSKLGIFQLSYQLKHSNFITAYDENRLCKELTWLEEHLKVPSISNKRAYHDAIFWLTDSAHEPLHHIRMLKYILQNYGFWVDQITTAKPGIIIYRDGWQIAAKPFRKRAR